MRKVGGIMSRGDKLNMRSGGHLRKNGTQDLVTVDPSKRPK